MSVALRRESEQFSTTMIKLNQPTAKHYPEAWHNLEEVLTSRQVARGRFTTEVEAFSQQLFGKKYGVAVNSGSIAIELALAVCGIGDGDEVLVPNFTYIATINSILRLGALPVLVDIGDDLTMDPEDAAAKASPKTKAILAVDLYGIPAKIPELKFAVANSLDIDPEELWIIEDAAQAAGAKLDNLPIGLHSHMVTTSFYATKNVFGGEGGMVATSSPALAEALRRLRSNQTVFLKDTDKILVGSNFHMSEFASAVLLPQLHDIGVISDTRRMNAKHYNDILGRPSYDTDNRELVYHQYPVRCVDSRQSVMNAFEIEGIETGIYYSDLFRSVIHPTPRADFAASTLLCIPVNHNLEYYYVDKVAATIQELYSSGRIDQV